MLSYKNLIFITFFALGSCGFEPLNTPTNGPDDPLLRDIKIADVTGVWGNRLERELVAALTPKGRPTHPRYTLSVSTSETKASVGILKDATASRYHTTLDATFTLVDSKTHKPLVSGKSTTTGNFSVLSSPLNRDEDNTSYLRTTVSEAAAKNRNIQQMAKNIKMHLLIYLRRKEAGLETAPSILKEPLGENQSQ